MVTSKNKSKKDTKKSLIEQLEETRSSKVIVYFTGEKLPPEQFATKIASDVLPLFRKILEGFPMNTNKISLVLNTSGGSLETPWPLVNLIREYCNKFEVIVLEKALSAGTLIALGADKIVMLPYSNLSPIDPTANIIDDTKKQITSLEIENIVGYIDFAKEKVGITEQSALAEVMKELTKEIKPTLLGSVNRTHSLIRRLSKNLLYLHKIKPSDKQVKEITENLTQELYSHTHLINRKEAQNEVGFNKIIEFSDKDTKHLADKLFNECVRILEMEQEFNPQEFIGGEQEKEYNLSRALIHTSKIKYEFKSSYKLVKIPDPSGKQLINIISTSNKWLLVN